MNKVNKLTLTKNDIPTLLRHIPDSPKQLYVRGSVEALSSSPKLAVVGARKATTYGTSVTQKLVGDVAGQGVSIVSGLALGIDGIAHQSALEQNGLTIAVMPCGLDKLYPTTHQHLAKKILDHGGAIVSEYPDGTPPLRNHFIERNRIVSGLCEAILITEAAQKSGTLHTARFALEQGRSVMAVPGNITSQFSRGTNKLIATGARVISDASDILDELGLTPEKRQQQIIFGANKEEDTILELLRSGHSEGKILLEHSQLDAALFSQTMTMLEISGKIRALGADNWRLL